MHTFARVEILRHIATRQSELISITEERNEIFHPSATYKQLYLSFVNVSRQEDVQFSL